MRRSNLLFSTIVSSILLTGAANAAPIDPGSLNPLTNGSDYTAAPTAADVGSGSFSFDYLFDVTSNVSTTLFASSHQPFPGAGDPSIINLTLSWLDSAGNPLAGASSLQVTDANGQTLAGKLVLGLLAGGAAGTDYILRVMGTAANGGRFDFDVLGGRGSAVGTAPLPASALLFSGGMACLVMLMRRRERPKDAIKEA